MAMRTLPTKPAEDEPSPHDSAIDVSSVTALRSRSGSTRSNSPENRDLLLKLWRPPKSEFFSSDSDFYCFDFFRNRTAPEFAAYFDSTIFRTFVIRACFLYPTVLQAAAAVGAVHRRFELGISEKAFEFCALSNRQFRKATRCLEDDLRSGHPNGPEINMVSSLLLAIFETFQNNYDSALTHMTNGFRLLLQQKKLRTTRSETQYKAVNIGFESLHKLSDSLERNVPRMFKSETHILAYPGVDSSLDPVPKAFENLAHARDVLITEGQWIWDAWLQLELGNLNKFETQQFHISRLLEWSMAYAEYSKTDKCRNTPSDRRPAHLLKAYREVMYLVLLTQIAFHDPEGKIIVPPCDPPETCTYHKACVDYTERKSALNAHLARCLVLVENIVNEESHFGYDEHSLSVDSGIGPPLYVGQTRCRSTKVRHQVTSLLAKTALQKKLWDTLGVYSIAEKLSSIEEHAVVAVGAIPAVLDPKWVDITFFLEDGKVLLRHCRQDEYGGLLWTQEWLSS